MNDYLPHYLPSTPTTWAYYASLLTIALYFKFNRLLSLRNIDLILLVLLAPGLIIIGEGYQKSLDSRMLEGYVWLFVVAFLFLLRMLFDSALVRRPLLEANLARGGMVFLGVALFLFLTAKILHTNPVQKEVASIPQAKRSISSVGATQPSSDAIKNPEQPPPISEVDPNQEGPGFHLFSSLVPNLVTPIFPQNPNDDSPNSHQENLQKYGPTCTIAILSHLAIVIGIVLVGYLHFGNINSGIAAGLMYLLLPYTMIYVGWVRHVLPAALMIWAVVVYRRPLLAGILIGLASGTVYYPIFLLPLWISFYWHRGAWRFVSGVVAAIFILSIVQAFYVGSYAEYIENLKLMLGIISPTEDPKGFWSLLSRNYRAYRIPVLAAHIALCGSYAIWPVRKNLGTLMSGSAALMISTQFWEAYGGGISIAWYMPLLLLSIFRPNLEDRVALSVLGDGWLKVHRNGTSSISRAA